MAAFGNTLLISAPYQGGGVAYIFRLEGSSWVEKQKLVSHGFAYARFGSAVAIHGDHAMIGAPADSFPDSFTGSAYSYEWNGSSWVETNKFRADGTRRSSHFGSSIAIDGKFALIGARVESVGGSAYSYRFNGQEWIQKRRFTPQAGGTGTFGTAVASGSGHVAIGAPYHASGSEGRTYLYNPPTVELSPQRACRAGNVNAATGTPVDVLFVNDSAGVGPARELVVQSTEPIRVRMAEPPSNPGGPAPFALYVHGGAPSGSSVRVLPRSLGSFCNPTPLTDAAPANLLKMTNNIGHTPRLGKSDFQSQPAPSMVASQPGGVGRAVEVFLQGLILDEQSLQGQAAVTNGVLVKVLP